MPLDSRFVYPNSGANSARPDEDLKISPSSKNIDYVSYYYVLKYMKAIFAWASGASTFFCYYIEKFFSRKVFSHNPSGKFKSVC